MSSLRFSGMLAVCVLWVGFNATAAMSDDAPPPREKTAGWDNGPLPGHPAPGGPTDARRPQPTRDGKGEHFDAPELRGDAGGEQSQPPGDHPHRPHPQDRDRPRRPGNADGPGEDGPPPGGPAGDRRQPPGHPPGYPPRGREDLQSLKTTDPELYKAIQEDRDLERQTRDQADQFRQASKDEQAKIKAKLTEIVGKHFELRQQLRNLEVKRLEQQLKALRDRIDQREKDRKEIVEKRVIELTGTDEDEHF